MIALFHWIARVFKKDIKFLSRYERSHPHFLYLLGIDVLVSIAVIIVGFQIFAGPSSTKQATLETTGGVSMSADRLMIVAKIDDKPVYWLGPMADSRYSFNSSVAYVSVITYIVPGATLGNGTHPKLTVETYESSVAYREHPHPSINVDTHRVVADKGFTVSYDSKTLKAMTITIQRAPQVVVVSYPKRQSATSLLQDAAKLAVIK